MALLSARVCWPLLASKAPHAARGCSLRLEQYVVLESPGDPVDDQPPIIAQRSEEPGVSRGPVHSVDTVFVLLVGGDDVVLQRLLAPATQHTDRSM